MSSNPGNRLSTAMKGRTVSSEDGTVEEVRSTSIVVRTSSGLKEVPRTSTAYEVGDNVRVKDNVVLGRTTGKGSLPVYYV